MKKQNDKIKNTTTKEKVEEYNILIPILNSLYNEIKELSRKKQDSPLNNRILQRIKVLLDGESINELLDLLDEETLPTNSDAILIISQFKVAMGQYKDKYYYQSNSWDDPLNEKSEWLIS